MDDLDRLAVDNFTGRIVRKDLSKKIKGSLNVPIYVLEYLLGMYCATDDEDSIEQGVERVKKILADNYVRPDEAEKIKFKITEKGSFTVIDRVQVTVDVINGICYADLMNLGMSKIPISSDYVANNEKLLAGGIWCIIQLGYGNENGCSDESISRAIKALFKGKKKKDDEFDEDQYGVVVVEELTPIQMPNLNLNEIFEGRCHFTKEQWIDLILRSIGMEPTQLQEREKWHLLERLVPLVENNYNLCELGPRSTGKSHVYKEISPNSILVSGGQTTVANLFYNMGRRQVGLVGHWDCVAFDEVAGINFKDKDGIQIMKDYMNSGSFVRGKDEIAASASMVFVGNINYSVDVLLKTSHLFQPFPDLMASDTAFFDRMHYYLPGWEVPKFAPKHFTDNYGFITDYVSEYFRCMRKYAYGDMIDRYYKLGTTLNQRDVMAVRKTVSGLVKIIYPNGECTKEELEEILRYALEGRRRVKEQLKRIGGMEFYAVNFSYIDNETFEEKYVGVPEQGSDKLITEGTPKPGTVHTVVRGTGGMFGVYRIEEEAISGNGKFTKVGTVSKSTTDSISNAVNYFKANAQHISSMISLDHTDFMMDIRDLQGQGAAEDLSLATLIGMASAVLKKPVLNQLAVLGGISIGGTINTIEELANILQVAHDAGANKILIPSNAKKQIVDVPDDLFVTFQIIFYNSPEDAVFKALGIE
jgi:ATP-dependent Lon protease